VEKRERDVIEDMGIALYDILHAWMVFGILML
jgi:hypothetical protein